jgi:hypothetical protein
LDAEAMLSSSASSGTDAMVGWGMLSDESS